MMYYNLKVITIITLFYLDNLIVELLLKQNAQNVLFLFLYLFHTYYNITVLHLYGLN